MKKLFTTILVISSLVTLSFAQRFVFVDTDYILSSIPEYKQAQKNLDDIAEGWRGEIDRKYQDIDDLYKAFQAEQILMPEDLRMQKQQEIEQKEKEVKEYQKKKFGFEGELFHKKEELIKPIQDKIYNEIQKMAVEKAYDFIFDKSNGVSMLYASSKYDKSDDILRAMGYVPTSTKQTSPK